MKPTMRERRTQSSNFGHRPTNAWGEGDLPAPWAEGDVIRLPADPTPDQATRFSIYGAPWEAGGIAIVSYAASIDDGDAWYFRIEVPGDYVRSDRLHVAWASRSTFDADMDFLAGATLVDTADPAGLAVRCRLLADGWGIPDVA